MSRVDTEKSASNSGCIGILLIEQNAGTAEQLRQSLESVAILKIEWVQSLSKAVTRLSNPDIDVILLDSSALERQPANALDELLQRAPHVPVLITLDPGDQSFAWAPLHKGADGFVIKGHATGAQLHDCLMTAIERKKQEGFSRHLSMLVHSSLAAIISEDANGIIQSWNPAAENMLGYSADEAVGQHISFLVPETSDLEERTNRLFQGQGSATFETHLMRKDGSAIDASITISEIKNQSAVVGISSIIHEVTKRERKQSSLRRSLERYELALMGAVDGLWDWNLDTNEIFYSARMREMLGLHDANHINPNAWLSLVHPADYESVKDSLTAHLLDHTPFDIEFRLKAADGEYRWFNSRGQAVWNATGKPIRVCGSLRDITEQRRHAEHLRRMQLVQQREEFMAMLTHDLKNPLIGANRILELLESGKLGELTEDQTKILRQLRDSNQELVTLIQDVIDVYRYEKDVKELEVIEADLHELAAACVDEIVPLAYQREIEIKTDIPDAFPIIRVDAKSIRRVLKNLLDNAIKFTPTGGVITVTLDTEGDQAILRVQDTGPGIPQDEIRHLFKRFWQGHSGMKYTSGAGLGLYLCKQIVTAHNGSITCDSELKRGTTITVNLPMVQREPEAAR